MIAVVIVFWLCLTVCVYIYFGYPALLWVMSRVAFRPVREGDAKMPVTLVIPAHNEQKNIAAKLENSLALDYPPELVEILVISNGSTDATDSIVREWNDPRIRLISLEEPGKMGALNEGAKQARGEILIFTDADFLLDPDVLNEMARKFNDPEVGGVCGARKSGMERQGDATGEGDGLYARWDKWQKIKESRIGSVFAADGLLYAIRKSLYVPILDPAQADDIAISVQVPLQGSRLLFEPKATAWENATVHAAEELRRKIRVTNHSVRALLNLKSRLLTSGFYSVELLSHKLIRHFIPFFMIPLYLASLVLASRSWFYLLALLGQTLIYGLALLGAILREHPLGRKRPLYIPFYFCFVNACAFLGILQILRGERLVAWSSRPNTLS